MPNPNKLPPDIEGIDKTLKDVLWTAYCNGRAGNKYVPEEVTPGLKVRLTEHGVGVKINGKWYGLDGTEVKEAVFEYCDTN